MKPMTCGLLALAVLLAGCKGAPTQPEAPGAAQVATATVAATTAPANTPPPAPATAAPSTPLAALSAAPQAFDQLAPWLSAAWQAGRDPHEIQAALQAARAQQDAQDFALADLDGDGRPEWLVTLYDAPRTDSTSPLGPTGQFWVVGAGGVLYRYDARSAGFASAPRVVFQADLTGDEHPDVVVDSKNCGASTCFDSYFVISAQGGSVRNVVKPVLTEPAGPEAQCVNMASVTDVRLTASKPAELVVRGGLFGSAGAGIMRERTETWGWDGQAVVLKDTQWAASDYRFHVLYDANDAFAKGDEQTATAAYLRVLDDKTLKDAPSFVPDITSSDPSVRQFAAFRLVLIQLKGLAEVEAHTWDGWLSANYPDAPLARAAHTLLRTWGQSNNLATACAAVTRQLQGEKNPTGALADMGYGNPAL